jgi:hypothetical protein
MVAGRNSVGYELDSGFKSVFESAVSDLKALSRDVIQTRLDRHESFLEDRHTEGETPEYDATHYEFPVTTKQERRLRLYAVASIEETETGYTTVHTPYTRSEH